MANYVISYYLHLTCIFVIVSQLHGIKVDFNTNTGPIIPPTTTQRPVPQPPFRDPAPVWEDQLDDVPNPNPYRYIPPPPSRPRTFNNDIFSNSIEQNTDNNNRRYNNINNNQPQGIPPQEVRSQVVGYQQPSSYFDDTRRYNSVPSLSVRYIPNVGLRYYAVVPIVDSKLHHLQTNQVEYSNGNNNNNYNNNYNDKYLYKREYFDKPNGKFNAKLKKYKAYEMEKQKFNNDYVPYNVYYKEVPRKSFDYVNAPVSANNNNNNNNNNNYYNTHSNNNKDFNNSTKEVTSNKQ